MSVTYKRATIADKDECVELLSQLYHSSASNLEKEIKAFIESDQSIFIMAVLDQKTVGCSHCSLRVEYVEGSTSSPVGYLEGVFVLPEYRGRGLAKQLVSACERWAKSKGCIEFASDVKLENLSTQTFHQKLGFNEVTRIICYTKIL